jgi:HD-GYP domain-containing protein (c-di-GMP phosphodiesterase class II)
MQFLLVQNSDEAIRERLSFSLEGRFHARVREALSLRDGIKILTGSESSIDMIIYDDSIPTDSSELSQFWEAAVKIPSVIIKEGTRSQTIPSEIQILDEIERSRVGDQLVPRIAEIVKKNSLRREDSEYGFVRVRSKLLLDLGSLRGDVFIRLSDRKFLKIFLGGDRFEQSDFDKYTGKKKVEYFYLREEDCEAFIDTYSEDLNRLLHKTPPASPNAVFSMAEEAQETLQSLVKQFGFTPKVQEITKQQVALTIKAMGKSPKLGDILDRLKENDKKYISSHSIMASYVACGLAAEMEWDSEGTFFKLNLASFLHDMTLENNALAEIGSLEELEKQKLKFSPDEIRAYKLHTMHGGELAQRFHEIPPDVDNIIFQHHERPDGEGFPRRMKQNQISPLASLFIVAHDFVKHCYANPAQLSMKDFMAKNELYYSLGNFKKIAKVLQDLEK